MQEAQAFAVKIKRTMEARAATSDVSTPKMAVDALKQGAEGDDRLRAVGKLSRIADDKARRFPRAEARRIVWRCTTAP